MKKYIVTANKSTYYSKSFGTVEEATQAVSQLINDGYSIVSIRDDEATSEGIW